MTTIEPNNFAVSPKNYSWGFFSLAIHSPGPRLCLRFYYTAHITQITSKLRSFYAKQTQFQKSQNEPNYLWNKGVSKYPPSRTPPKQTQFPHRRSQFFPTPRQRAGNPRQAERSEVPTRRETAQPTTKTQNKPNLPNAKMNLTSYGDMDYEQKPPFHAPAKQTQFPHRTSDFIPTRRWHAANQTCFRLPKSDKKCEKNARFPVFW